MKRMKKGLYILGGALAPILASVPAFAEGGWSPTFTVDTAPVFTVAGIVVTAIGSIWCIKKVIKLGNHS